MLDLKGHIKAAASYPSFDNNSIGTATGDLSRNRRVGLLLAQGLDADAAVRSLGHVAEGVYCARTVLARAESLGVDMPITRCVVALLDGSISPVETAVMLMERDARSEHG